MTEREALEQLIALLEAQRATSDAAVVDLALTPLLARLARLEGHAEAKQRKQVTILFADVSQFTTIVEKMDPEEAHDTISALWSRLDRAITAYDGLIDKHLGDGVMALFGAPTAHEDDPERAVWAALAMQSELRAFVGTHEGRIRGPRPLPTLNLRIGINTGRVLLGQVGTTGEYTAIGDAVNVASRLEKAAPVGGILISHATYQQVAPLFDVEPLTPLPIKGRSEPVQVYVVRRAKPRGTRWQPRGVEGMETPLVGREAELRQLQTAFGTVQTLGQVQVATVVGVAGVGKSRLMDEFIQWLELLPDRAWFFRGRSSSETTRIPYSLIREMFSARFGIRESDSASVAQDKLVGGISESMEPDQATSLWEQRPLGSQHRRVRQDSASADASTEVLEKQAHLIGQLIGLDFAESPHIQEVLRDARQFRDQAFYAIQQFFHRITQASHADPLARRPAVVLLEDIHWADEGSLELIEYLVHTGRNLPLMILCLARPTIFERRPQWGQTWGSHQRIELHSLSDEESQQLIHHILHKVANIPPSLRDLIVHGAGGNPYYVEELIKMLIEERVILKGDQQWEVRPERLAEVSVPSTLTGVLQARLDGLPTHERAALQRAAVVGRVFWDSVIAYLQEGKDPGEAEGSAIVQQVLEDLQTRELIFERGSSAFMGTHEYIFKHSILRDVTYESVLIRLRREYHAQVANWLITWSGKRVGEYVGVIGEHFERAEQLSKAAAWYLQAGRRALDGYALGEAAAYYTKVLAFWPDDHESLPQRIPLYQDLGWIYYDRARFDDAIAAWHQAISAAQTLGNTVVLAQSWHGLARAQSNLGDHEAALESLKQAEAYAREANAPQELSRALYRQSWDLYRLGQLEAALAVCEQALDLSLELDYKLSIGECLHQLGVIHDRLGHAEQAWEYRSRALALYRAINDRPTSMWMLNGLGESARLRGDYETAIPLYTEAIALARETGNWRGEMVARSNMGGALVALGAYAEAERDLRVVVREVESGYWLSESYRFLAEACLGQGRADEALRWAQQALAQAQARNAPEDRGGSWRVMGLIAARLRAPVLVGQDSYDAEACFGESVGILTELGAEGERARALRAWALVTAERGAMAEAERLWHEAREVFGRLGMIKEVERMQTAPFAKDAPPSHNL